jgi:shikimate kinase
MRIFLTGYMGSGKSTLGKRLANKLKLNFIDLDEYFEQKFRSSISLFFERFGEDSFRKLEHEVLMEVIEKHSNIVISTGGGTPCYFNNMDLMNQSGTTVYLKLPPAVLASRLSNSPFRYRRPKLKGLDTGTLLETVTNHLKEREAFYMQSELIIEAFEMKVENIVNLIVGHGE